MRLEYDLDVSALYIVLSDSPVAVTREHGDNANVDLDAEGRVVGIEVISAAHSWPLQAILSEYAIEETDAAQLLRYFTTEVPVTGSRLVAGALRIVPMTRRLVADALPVMVAEPTAPASVSVPA
jgi:uncharacterized protein YuzE